MSVASERRVVALLPKRYDEALTGALGEPAVNPLRGSRGIGDQRGILGRIARGELDPVLSPLEDALRSFLWRTHGIVGFRRIPQDELDLIAAAAGATR